mmetsp:Transcript_4380/g.9744  ORF Transcript_4380/g.9744 Transcript_4380/m.9744 type:complete len:90 (-) Transcript_4380:900-1169(-)
MLCHRREPLPVVRKVQDTSNRGFHIWLHKNEQPCHQEYCYEVQRSNTIKLEVSIVVINLKALVLSTVEGCLDVRSLFDRFSCLFELFGL